MHKALTIIVIFALCAISTRADICLERESTTAGDRFFCSIEESKRNTMVIHYLTEALLLNGYEINRNQLVNHPRRAFGVPPPNFAQNLLTWVMNQTNKSKDEVAVIVAEADPSTNRNVCVDVCFEVQCEPWEAGCMCCPLYED